MTGFTFIVDEEKAFAPGAGGWSPWRMGASDQVLDVRDSTCAIDLHQLTRDEVRNTAYEMISHHVIFLTRDLDGERWVSWRHEHAVADSIDAASLELWNQLGQYLESLEGDEARLAPDLREDLTELRSILRRR